MEPRTIEQLIAYFEEHGDGCGLISDDCGHWAVSTSGFQSLPENPPADIDSTFWVEAHEWKPTIREALEAYMDERESEPHTPCES